MITCDKCKVEITNSPSERIITISTGEIVKHLCAECECDLRDLLTHTQLIFLTDET